MTKMQIIREKKGFSRELMAIQLKVSFWTYKSYETEKRQAPVARLKQMADILETTIDSLVD